MYRFIESIKILDKKIFLTHLHQKRMQETLASFGAVCTIDIEKIYKKTEHAKNGLFKFRILYDLDNNFETELLPYQFRQLKSFELVENNSLDYHLKYENRKILNEMKAKSTAEEIIVVQNNFITDSSYTNLIFLKNKKWFTPKTFLLNGVQRKNLLENKNITEADIRVRNLKEFSHFQMINALNPFDERGMYPIELITNLSGF